MNAPLSLDISRRSLLAGGGALIVSFSLPGAGKVAAQEAEATGGGIPSDMLDSWLRIDAQGVATVYTGRAEFGATGIDRRHALRVDAQPGIEHVGRRHAAGSGVLCHCLA